MASMPGDAPILVDSAGCGAAMKDYGHLLGTEAATAFSARVFDVHEWVAARGSTAYLPRVAPRRKVGRSRCRIRVTCVTCNARTSTCARFSGRMSRNSWSSTTKACAAVPAARTPRSQPNLAGAIRDRKVAAIERSGATVVASANPGCVVHLANAGLDVRHPMTLIDEAIR